MSAANACGNSTLPAPIEIAEARTDAERYYHYLTLPELAELIGLLGYREFVCAAEVGYNARSDNTPLFDILFGNNIVRYGMSKLRVSLTLQKPKT